jgi:hypothetical protein
MVSASFPTSSRLQRDTATMYKGLTQSSVVIKLNTARGVRRVGLSHRQPLPKNGAAVIG